MELLLYEYGQSPLMLQVFMVGADCGVSGPSVHKKGLAVFTASGVISYTTDCETTTLSASVIPASTPAGLGAGQTPGYM